MRDDYAKTYRQLYEQHFWWRAREALVLRELERLSRRIGHERILDVGCGDGLLFPQLERFGTVEGIEPFAPLSDDRKHLPIHCRPFDDSFRPSEPYSLILMLDVLEHLQQPAGALRHALRLLEPEGSILITVPAFMLLWTAHDDINQHQIRYTRPSFAALSRDAGLELRELRYFFHWSFFAKLAVRAREQLSPGVPQPERVPAEPINRMLLGLSLAEQRLPLRLPFGSSLLAIGGHPPTQRPP
jgi:SAM-dependent methyltransferase